MTRSILSMTLTLSALAGCLEAGPAPSGIQLVQGRDVSSIGFVDVGGKTFARFERHRAFASGSLGAVSDIWIVGLDGSGARKVVTGRSDHGASLSPAADGLGYRYFMVDERQVGATVLFTLLRLDANLDENLRIDNVIRYQVGSTTEYPELILYDRPHEGQSLPDIVLWNGASERVLGVDGGAGQTQFMGGGTIYAILGEDRVLSRFDTPDSEPVPLRDQVLRYQLRGDGKYVALTVLQEGKSQDVMLDIVRGVETPFLRPNPTMWLGFQDTLFVYLQAATGTTPAELHAIDVASGKEQSTELPEPLVDLISQSERPNTNELLLQDSQGHAVFVSSVDGSTLRSFDGRMYSPLFSGDGNEIFYIDPEAPTVSEPYVHGPILSVPSDFSQSPQLVSPPGSSSRAGNFFLMNGETSRLLVFWTHMGRGNWDLYFKYLDTGVLRLVTRSILSVSIGEHSIYGILNASQQDETGDLVSRNIDTGAQVLYSRTVAEDVVGTPTGTDEAQILYVVRGRAPSERDGVWLTPLLPPPQPDAGTN